MFIYFVLCSSVPVTASTKTVKEAVEQRQPDRGLSLKMSEGNSICCS